MPLVLLAAVPALPTETVDGAEGDASVEAQTFIRKPQDTRAKFTESPAEPFYLIRAEIRPGTHGDTVAEALDADGEGREYEP